MKIQMISTQPHLYAGKRWKIGDSFQATGRSDANLMIALGRAVEAPKPPVPPSLDPAPEPAVKTKRTYTRKVALPAPLLELAAAPETAPDTSRFYTRRDMEAE
jgi:hypothetical protein